MNYKKISTEDYYIASIDLLGAKNIIYDDGNDENLNKIRSIYSSWPTILKDGYFQDMKIRFFSDNVVIALQANKPGAADKLLETIGWVCSHFLRCGYKPRGGVCRGKFYIDDIFVWGSGLVDAYLLESKKAIYPRIIVAEDVLCDVGKHLREWMIFRDEDNSICLNYLKAFGGSKQGWINDINDILHWLEPEYTALKNRLNVNNEDEKKVYEKLNWLIQFVYANKNFWDSYKK